MQNATQFFPIGLHGASVGHVWRPFSTYRKWNFFVYLRLIIRILSLRTFAHLTVLSLSNPALNLTFSLLPITSSHPHARASDSTFDYWRYMNFDIDIDIEFESGFTMPRFVLGGDDRVWSNGVADCRIVT